MKKKILMIATFIMTGIMFLNPVQASTGSDSQAKTYRTQLFDEPQSIKLPKAETSYWFSVPAGTKISEAELTIILETSDTLLEDYSTATVEVNSVAIASINLLELAETPDMTWNVKIPTEMLKTDGSYNQLSIVTAQRSILGECADIDNPANWLIISDESSLLLTLVRPGAYALSDLYPYVFNRVETGNTINTQMVLAGKDEKAETSAALTLASAIGANFPYKKIEKMEVTDTASEDTDTCFVIDADAANDPPLNAGEGLISIDSADPVTVHAAGGGREGLEKAVNILTDPDILTQFEGKSSVIHSSHDSGRGALSAREDGLYILKDFGYDDINLAGAFHQQTFFTIRQPDGILGGPGSYFEVHFRHSDALVSDTSLLTVFFDGVPATSIQLSGTNTDNGKLKVKIPKDALSKGSFEISIDVYNYLGKIDCSKDWYDVAWTLIDSDSVVYLEPSNNTVIPSLSGFPSLWNGDTVVCIPDQSSDTVKQAVTMLAARNGQNTKLTSDYTFTHSLAEQDVSDSNIVIAGLYNRIDLPKAIADELYIIPGDGVYTIKGNVGTIPEAVNGKVVIQAVRSPYNFRRIVYVVFWFSDDGEKIFSDLMADRERLGSLKGEVSLVGKSSVSSLEVELSREAAIPLSPQVIISRAVRTTGIPFAGLVVMALLAVVIIILIIRQVRSKNR
ncbi:MAG: cellulose biosynthesis cyclic di-GMP-binding regulatory protein BcsB, partial [Lachnospiraceae bacterium]|nr:cellulose biosynthesis cyclic di-GMP-binding regulatory protein BcsB [Lachnospiraceae bacterium]